MENTSINKCSYQGDDATVQVITISFIGERPVNADKSDNYHACWYDNNQNKWVNLSEVTKQKYGDDYHLSVRPEVGSFATYAGARVQFSTESFMFNFVKAN